MSWCKKKLVYFHNALWKKYFKVRWLGPNFKAAFAAKFMFMDIISNSIYLIVPSYKRVSEQKKFKIKSVKISRLAEIPRRFVQFCFGRHNWLISEWSPKITDVYHVTYDLISRHGFRGKRFEVKVDLFYWSCPNSSIFWKFSTFWYFMIEKHI